MDLFSSLQRFITFGGKTDLFTNILIPVFAIIVGTVITIISLLQTGLTFHAPSILTLSAAGIIIGVTLLFYLIKTAGEYTIQPIFHQLTGVTLVMCLYLLISAAAVIVSYGVAETVTTQTLLTPIAWPAIWHAVSEGYVIMFGGVLTVMSAIILAAQNRRELSKQYKSIAEIEETFETESKKSLNRIENEIEGLGHIERSETGRLLEAVENGENSMLLGDGGVGKSGILKTVAERLDTPVLFLDATRYPGIQNTADLAEKIEFDDDLYHAITQLSLEAQLGVVIDQLDDIGGTEVQVLTNFIFEIVEKDNVSVIFACRKHDLQTHPEYKQLRNPKEFSIRPDVKRLQRSKAQSHIEELIGSEPSDDLIKVGRNLQYLDVIARLALEDVDLTNISGKATVWDKYRKSLTEEDQPGNDNRRGSRVLQRAIEYATEATEDDSNIFSVPTNQDWADNQLLNRGVIVAANEERGNRRHRFRHPDFQTYLYAWDAVQDGESLGTVTDRLDDRLGKDVFRWMLLLYLQSDTGLKSQFPDIQKTPEQADNTREFLEELLNEDSGLGYYATTAILDEIKTWNAEVNDGLASVVLDKLENRNELYRYFFDDATTDPSWAYTLKDRGAFNAPSLRLIGFLGDLAPEHPDVVSELLASVEEADEQARGMLVSVVQEMPADEAANQTELVLNLITESGLDRDQISYRVIQLMTDLVKKGQPDAGLDLLEELTAPRRSEEGRDPVTKADLYTLNRAFEEVLGILVDQRPSRTIEVLETNLRAVLHLEAELKERDIKQIAGYYMSPIDSSESERLGDQDLLGLLTKTTRKAQELRLDNASTDKCQSVINAYLQDTTLFKRLGLYLLNRYADDLPDLLHRVLRNESYYTEYLTEKDFLQLLSDQFASLDLEIKEDVIQIILSVPIQDSLREAAERRSKEYDDHTANEIFEQRRDEWIYERLWLIRDTLPRTGERVLSELREKYGEPPTDLLSTGGVRMGTVSQESPKSVEELKQMPSEDLIQYCINWEPDDEEGWEETNSGGFREVSRRGLAEAVAEVILDDPSRYAEQFSEFRNADSIYTTELFQSVRKILDNDPQSLQEDFIWSEIFHLCQIIATNQKKWDTEARIASVRLIKAGVVTDAYEYLHESPELQELLLAFLDDPNPSPERDRPPEGHAGHNNPLQVSLNTVRPVALDGLIIYSLKAAKQQSFDGYSNEHVSGFEPVIREQLVSMLEDPSLAIRAIYGQRLHQIWWLDHGFVLDNLESLFPRKQNTENRNRFSATMDTYVAYNKLHPDLYPKLRPYYFHAIDLLDEDGTTEVAKAAEGLAYHVISAYLGEYEDLNDSEGLVTYLYDRNVPELTRQIAWGLWRSGSDNEEIRQEWKKVLRLWEQRLKQVDNIEVYSDEMQWFVEWLPLIEDHASLDDLTELIEQTLPFIASKRRTWETLEEYLSTYAVSRPETVIRIYQNLMNQGTRPYAISFDEETEKILKPALDHPDIKSDALDIAEQFATDGDESAREFLDRNT